MSIHVNENEDIHTSINNFEALKLEAEKLLEGGDFYPDYYLEELVEVIYELAETNNSEVIMPLLATMEEFNGYPDIVTNSQIAISLVDPNLGMTFLPSLLKEGHIGAQKVIEVIDKLDLSNIEGLTEPLLDLLYNEWDQYLLTKVIKIIGEIGDKRSIRRLIDLLLYETIFSDELKREIINALRKFGLIAVKSLIAELWNEDLYVQETVIENLAILGNNHAVEPLITKLQDDDRGIRYVAAIALGKFQDDRATTALLKIFRDSKFELRDLADIAKNLIISGSTAKIRIKAANALFEAIVQTGDEKHLNVLIQVFKTDKDKNVRKEIARFLGAIRQDQIAETLIEGLKDASPDVVATIIETLGTIKSINAVLKIIPFLKNENIDLKRQSLKALSNIGDKSSTDAIIAILQEEKSNLLRSEAAESLGLIKDERAVRPLIAALWDEDLDVRKSAAKALGEIQDTIAIEPLNALQNYETDEVLSKIISDSLEKIHQTRVE